ncbi:hypothetical protein [Terrarubrum flagellatum]|uniref:hypothetical protein n=1 Tax=Terrirubrum flagellatum TaxID=2895980 RepID=UPI0031450879
MATYTRNANKRRLAITAAALIEEALTTNGIVPSAIQLLPERDNEPKSVKENKE